MKKLFLILLSFSLMFVSCNDPKDEPVVNPDPDPVVPVPDPEPDPDPDPDPDPEPDPEVKVEKDRSIWVSATANWARLATKGDIKTWVKKIKNYGFNEIIVEVKVMDGGVLYESDLFPMFKTYNGITRDFDYFQYFIDQCRENDMKIGASITVFPTDKLGETAQYKDSDFEGRYCQELRSAAGITDIRNNTSSGVFPFLNPADPFVRQFIMDLVEEIVTKYDIDSFTLDYCRYQDYHSDFSDTSRKAFEEWLGETVPVWPDSIMSFNADGGEVYGSYFNKYLEWRTWVITGYVEEIGRRIKAINSDVKFEYWAASWWPLYGTAQNWASDSRDLTGTFWWSTPTYYKTGFAKYLDVFQNGAYYTKLMPEYDGSAISYQLNQGKKYINGDCKMYGSFSVSGSIDFDPGDAAYWCLKNTDGVMVFELTHIESHAYWASLKAGIDKAIEDGSAYYVQ